MPRKTKKEKIIAQYRRKLQSVKGRISVSPKSSPTQPLVESTPGPSQPLLNSYQLQFGSTPRENLSLPNFDTTELAAVSRDLTKTIVLSAVAIAIELGLFWRLQT